MIIENEIERVIFSDMLKKNELTDPAKKYISRALQNISKSDNKLIPLIAAVCNEFDITPHSLRSKRRHRNIVWSRFIIMHYINTVRLETFENTGSFFGLDHCTAIHAVRRVGEMKRFDKEFAAKYERIMKKISEIQK